MSEVIHRQFVAAGDGQVHYRYCGRADLPPVVLLHGSPGSSYNMQPLMRHLASHRRVLALDLPGNGDSTPLPMEQPEVADLARAVMEALDGLGLETFDLYGWHTGGTVCIELSINHSERLNGIVLDGVSVFDASERAMLQQGNRQAPDIPVDHEGSQFLRAFMMVRDAHLFYPWWDRGAESRRDLGLPSAEYLHGEAMEVLKACGSYFKSYRASIGYPKRERLQLMRNRTLAVACPSDQLFDHQDIVAALVPGCRKAVYPGASRDEDVAQLAVQMLDFYLEAERPGGASPKP